MFSNTSIHVCQWLRRKNDHQDSMLWFDGDVPYTWAGHSTNNSGLYSSQNNILSNTVSVDLSWTASNSTHTVHIVAGYHCWQVIGVAGHSTNNSGLYSSHNDILSSTVSVTFTDAVLQISFYSFQGGEWPFSCCCRHRLSCKNIMSGSILSSVTLQQLPVSENNTELFMLLSAVLRTCVSELSCVTNVFAVELNSFPPFNGRTRQIITLILHSPFPLGGGIVLHKTSLPLTALEQRPPLTLHATIGTRVVQVCCLLSVQC